MREEIKHLLQSIASHRSRVRSLREMEDIASRNDDKAVLYQIRRELTDESATIDALMTRLEEIVGEEGGEQ